MIKKLLSFLGALIAFNGAIVAHNSMGEPDVLPCLRAGAHALYQSNWHMLEDIFITQPEERITRIIGMGGIIGATSLAAGVGTFFAIYKGIHYLNRRQTRPTGGVQPLVTPYPFLDAKKNLIAAGSGIASTILSYTTLKSVFLEREQMKQLERLLRQWSEVKELFPKELHSSLNKLAALDQKNQSFQQLQETTRLIKSAIHSHFPEKYKASKSTFARSRLNVNLNIDLVRIADKIINFFS